MLTNDYVLAALKTESQEYSQSNMRLGHALIGISTEVSEILYPDYEALAGEIHITPNEDWVKNRLEEIGDVLWYCAIACDELGVTFDEAVDQAAPFDENSTAIWTAGKVSGDLLDITKKEMFCGKSIDFTRVTSLVGTIINTMDTLAQNHEWTLSGVMEVNINKLAKRYPDGYFDAYLCAEENRDREAEATTFKI